MNDRMEEDMGCIVGAIVQVNPDVGLDANANADANADVRQLLTACEGVEIHAEDECSRLVITMEAATSKSVLKLTENIQNMKGVLSVTPVYQHCEENLNNEQDGGWKWR